jgi:hypothetical protein
MLTAPQLKALYCKRIAHLQLAISPVLQPTAWRDLADRPRLRNNVMKRTNCILAFGIAVLIALIVILIVRR